MVCSHCKSQSPTLECLDAPWRDTTSNTLPPTAHPAYHSKCSETQQIRSPLLGHFQTRNLIPHRIVAKFTTTAKPPAGGKKMGESAKRRAPSPWVVLGCKNLRGEVPELAIEPHVLPDRRDSTCAGEPPVGRSSAQTTPQQPLLHTIHDGPEVIPRIL